MKTYQKILAVIALSSVCMAAPAPSANEGAVKKTKKHHAVKAEEAKPVCEACEAIKQLKEQVQAQQAEIDQLKHVQPQAPVVDEKAAAAAAAAQQQAAAAAAAAADANAKAAAAQSDVAGLKTDVTSTQAAVEKDQKRIGELELPPYIHYKGVKITPGGWLEANTIYRVHNDNADSADNFGAQPFSGNSNAHLSEVRFSARHSNVNLLFQGKVHGLAATGYFEMDFQGAAPTANENQTNSFQPRIRELWANVDSDSGWHFLGGQTWSLIVSNRDGIAPKHEMRPAVIDAAYVTGFHYARETTFRVTKTLMNKKVAVALAVENPATVASIQTAGVVTPPTTQGLSGSPNTLSPSPNFFANATSTNLSPDVVVKIAFDPGWGHYEVGGIARFYRDRVIAGVGASTPRTNITESGAFTVNAVLPLVRKKVDFVFTGLAGKGIGRFGTTGAPDVTQRPSDGALVPIKGAQVMAGFETHPTPKFDFYLYGGNEYYQRTAYVDGVGTLGYGSASQSLAGCSLENPGTCVSANRDTWEVTPQLWYRIFKGKEGTLQYGIEYSYVHRRVWEGVVAAGARQPNSINNIIMSSFRYYIP
jgi:hypothetical protein